jgi:hypothetical protein
MEYGDIECNLCGGVRHESEIGSDEGKMLDQRTEGPEADGLRSLDLKGLVARGVLSRTAMSMIQPHESISALHVYDYQ